MLTERGREQWLRGSRRPGREQLCGSEGRKNQEVLVPMISFPLFPSLSLSLSHLFIFGSFWSGSSVRARRALQAVKSSDLVHVSALMNHPMLPTEEPFERLALG